MSRAIIALTLTDQIVTDLRVQIKVPAPIISRAGTLLNTTTHRYWGNDHALGHNYDYGDPTLRYLPSDGYFYIVPSTPLRDGRTAGVPPSPYPCCFVQWVSAAAAFASFAVLASDHPDAPRRKV